LNQKLNLHLQQVLSTHQTIDRLVFLVVPYNYLDKKRGSEDPQYILKNLTGQFFAEDFFSTSGEIKVHFL
jgi:hypothetical protein